MVSTTVYGERPDERQLKYAVGRAVDDPYQVLQMNEQQTVAARDSEGNLWWFPRAEAHHWESTTLQGGELYRAAGRWVLLPDLASLTGELARIIEEQEALTWLLSNGYAPPGELADFAQRRRLR